MNQKEPDRPLVHVSGGSLNVQAMAVGNNARATVNNAAAALGAAGRDEILQKLQAVLDAVDRHGSALRDRETADALIKKIATETSQKKPDKINLKSFLGSLLDEVKSVSEIAKTVVPLVSAVSSLFS
jgi:hypothetical protein